MDRTTSNLPRTVRRLGRMSSFSAAAALSLFAACAESNDGNTPMDGVDVGGPTRCAGPAFQEDTTQCAPAGTDFQPRSTMPVMGPWPKCKAGDNKLVPIGSGVPSAAARVQAMDAMALRLWRNEKPITANDFLLSRNDYSVMEGLGSRVGRRQDVHYAELPGSSKLSCGEAGFPEMYPDRCAGPAKIKPIIDAAFQKGLSGERVRVQAALIEASLLWFMYLSTLSEVWTCGFDDIEDCDSMWGYLNGARPREMPLGLGKYIKELGPETYERSFDGALAVSCWREVDPAMPATNQNLYQLALGQSDKAVLRGLALILRDRIGQLSCSSGEQQQANLAFANVLGTFLDRAIRAADPTRADALKAQYTAATPAEVDVAKAQKLIDELFRCP